LVHALVLVCSFFCLAAFDLALSPSHFNPFE
jgi:hypothetical protein